MANLKTTTIDGPLIEISGTGTASQVAGAAGVPVVFESAATSTATDSRIGIIGAGPAGKSVIVYEDDDNSGYGTAVIGTVKGTSITYGTPVVFQASACSGLSVSTIYDSGSATWRFIVAYGRGVDNKGTTIVGTVSGADDTITFSSIVTFLNDITASPKLAVVSSTSIAISYQSVANTTACVIVGTLSGTTMTYGYAATFGGAAGHGTTNDITTVQNTPTLVISYRDLSNSNKLTTIAATVSGTTVTLGSPVVFYATNTTNNPVITNWSYPYNKFVVAWKNSSNGGTAIAGTLSGTTISFGTAVDFTSNNIAGDFDMVWDDDGSVGSGLTEGVIMVYRDITQGKLIATAARITGTNTITYGTPVVGPTSGAAKLAVMYDGHTEKIVSAYVDTANSNYGTAVVWRALPGGNITVDLATGNYFEIDLNDLGSVYPRRIHTFFINNPHASQVSSFTVQITQGNPQKQFRWDALQDKIHWPGGSGGQYVGVGLSERLLTHVDDAVDVLQFTTWDAGTTWYGKIVGKNFG